MTNAIVYRNVLGVEEFCVAVDAQRNPEIDSGQKHGNIPALASTVQKTKRWISELMTEVTETFVTPNSQLALHLPLHLGLAGKGVGHQQPPAARRVLRTCGA